MATYPKETIKGFVAFVRQRGVAGVAIAFIIGGAITKVVGSFVNDILEPSLGVIFGRADGLAALTIGPIQYGRFLVEAFNFLVIAWVIYLFFKLMGLEKFDVPKDLK